MFYIYYFVTFVTSVVHSKHLIAVVDTILKQLHRDAVICSLIILNIYLYIFLVGGGSQSELRTHSQNEHDNNPVFLLI